MRARRHLEEIARAPHPVGSVENSRVREYILGELRALGINPSVERMTAFYRESAVAFKGGMVNNVVARIPGTANTQAILLACHYDSVVEAPGASDDAHGVGVLLETARALRQTAPLRNDIVLLFSDGEEPEMLGGDAFATQSQWSKGIGLAMNFDARGTCGPSLMFETSSPDGALVREFARAAPYPRAASFFRDVYERMPAGTDFTFFKLHGIAGLNFAFIGNGHFYHTSEDNLKRMDDSSVQHQGSSALALARHFGQIRLPLTAAPNAAYFNLGNLLVHFPMSWVPFLEGALALLLVLACGRLRRRGDFRFAKMLLGLCFILGVGACAALFGKYFPTCLKMLQPNWNDLSFGQVYGQGWFTAGLLLPIGLVVFCLTTLAVVGLGRAEMAGAATALGLAISELLIWKLSGASHLGLALALSGLALLGLFGLNPKSGRVLSIATLVALAPVLLIWIPLMRYLDAGLGVGAWPVQAWLGVQSATLLAIAFVTPPTIRFWRWLSASLVLLVVLVVIGLRAGRNSSLQPQPGNIVYALDANTNAAFWVTRQGRLDPWSAAILGPGAKRQKVRAISTWLGGGEVFWKSMAPLLPLPLPVLKVLHSERTNATRTLDLQISSARGAQAVLVQFQSDRDTEIDRLNGIAPDEPEKPKPLELPSRYIDLRGLPPEGMTLKIHISGYGKVLVRLVERSTDLASVFPNGVPALPPGVMTAWEDDYYNRCVMITQLITLE